MTPGTHLVGEFYGMARQGQWSAVLAAWRLDPTFARHCAHHAQSTSGWTFLHQAAYFGTEQAVRELIGWGASAAAVAHDGQSADAVAHTRGHDAVARLVIHATSGYPTLWKPPEDTTALPSSCLWAEAQARRATMPMTVAYGGARVNIREGDQYYVDSFERVLVGWHGTYSPPCDMGGYPMGGLP